MPDSTLTVEIKNEKPLELGELTKSLNALASQYKSFANKNDLIPDGARLYVREIRSGSVILDLVDHAVAATSPVVESLDTISAFAGYVKTAVGYFLGKNEKSEELTTQDLRDFSNILNPIANDNASQLNMTVNVQSGGTVYLNIPSMEANAAQNAITREIQDSREPSISENIYERVLLYWHQATTPSANPTSAGNKVIIEEIDMKPLNIVFEDDSIRQIMLADNHPFNKAFIVDVKIQTVGGKPTAYKVVKFIEAFDTP